MSPLRARLLTLAPAALAMAALSAPPIAADVVHLKNGQRLEGDTIEADGQVAIHSAVGELRIPMDMVARIERGPSIEAEALRKLEATSPTDVDARAAIASELESNGAATLARRIYGDVLAIDPDHPVARRALGYVRCDGEWLIEDDCRRQRGQVLYQGRWVTTDERTVLETLEHQRRQSELERLRAEILVESARLEAQRQAPPRYSDYDPYYDPYYFGGVPYWWPGVSVVGLPPFDRSHRGGGGHVDHHRGGTRPGLRGDHAGAGPQHHRGGQPSRPLTPTHHRGARQ
jgi:hypothetical protein